MVQLSPVGSHLPGKHGFSLPVPESPTVLLNEALLGFVFFTLVPDTLANEGEGKKVRYTTTTDTVDLFNAVNGGSEPLKNYIGKELELTDIIVTSADVHEDVNDEKSPVVSKPCVHFYTTDGKHITTLSNGIIKSAKCLIECGLTPTKEAPVTIRIKTIETKKGTAHTFDLVKGNS